MQSLPGFRTRLPVKVQFNHAEKSLFVTCRAASLESTLAPLFVRKVRLIDADDFIHTSKLGSLMLQHCALQVLPDQANNNTNSARLKSSLSPDLLEWSLVDEQVENPNQGVRGQVVRN